MDRFVVLRCVRALASSRTARGVIVGYILLVVLSSIVPFLTFGPSYLNPRWSLEFAERVQRAGRPLNPTHLMEQMFGSVADQALALGLSINVTAGLAIGYTLAIALRRGRLREYLQFAVSRVELAAAVVVLLLGVASMPLPASALGFAALACSTSWHYGWPALLANAAMLQLFLPGVALIVGSIGSRKFGSFTLVLIAGGWVALLAGNRSIGLGMLARDGSIDTLQTIQSALPPLAVLALVLVVLGGWSFFRLVRRADLCGEPSP